MSQKPNFRRGRRGEFLLNLKSLRLPKGGGHSEGITHTNIIYSVFFFIRPQKQGCCELVVDLLRSTMTFK